MSKTDLRAWKKILIDENPVYEFEQRHLRRMRKWHFTAMHLIAWLSVSSIGCMLACVAMGAVIPNILAVVGAVLMWMSLLVFTFYFALRHTVALSQSIILDRQNGVLRDMKLTLLSTQQILLGKAAAYVRAELRFFWKVGLIFGCLGFVGVLFSHYSILITAYCVAIWFFAIASFRGACALVGVACGFGFKDRYAAGFAAAIGALLLLTLNLAAVIGAAFVLHWAVLPLIALSLNALIGFGCYAYAVRKFEHAEF